MKKPSADVVEVSVEVVKELKARGHVLVRADGSVELEEEKLPLANDGFGLELLCTMLGLCGLNPGVKWQGGVVLVRLRGVDWRPVEGDLLVFLLALAIGQMPSVKLKWEIMQKIHEGAKRPRD